MLYVQKSEPLSLNRCPPELWFHHLNEGRWFDHFSTSRSCLIFGPEITSIIHSADYGAPSAYQTPGGLKLPCIVSTQFLVEAWLFFLTWQGTNLTVKMLRPAICKLRVARPVEAQPYLNFFRNVLGGWIILPCPEVPQCIIRYHSCRLNQYFPVETFIELHPHNTCPPGNVPFLHN